MSALEREVNIWMEAEAFLESITDADVSWCERNLPAVSKTDVVVGVVPGDMPRRLYTAASRLAGLSRSAGIIAALEHDPETQRAGCVEARRLDQQGDILREIAWGAMRDEVPGAWESDVNGFSLRKGWTMVKYAQQHPLIEMAEALRPPPK